MRPQASALRRLPSDLPSDYIAVGEAARCYPRRELSPPCPNLMTGYAPRTASTVVRWLGQKTSTKALSANATRPTRVDPAFSITRSDANPLDQRTSRYAAHRRLNPTLSSSQGTLQRSGVSTFRACPRLRLPARICRRRLAPVAKLISPLNSSTPADPTANDLPLPRTSLHISSCLHRSEASYGPSALPRQPGTGTLARLDRMAASYSPARGKTHTPRSLRAPAPTASQASWEPAEE